MGAYKLKEFRFSFPLPPHHMRDLVSNASHIRDLVCTPTYRSVDASREVEEGEKGNGSSDDQFAKEEQEISHFVQNCHPNLDTKNVFVLKSVSAHHVSENQAESLLCRFAEVAPLGGSEDVGVPKIW